MTDNLLSLLSKLAYCVVNEEFNNNNVDSHRRNDKRFEKCFERVKRKGCDALLGKSNEPPLSDPCVTDYGGNWSPATLITDYGRELVERGGEKYNEILQSSVNCLLENDYDCANEALKFLLLLKKPLSDASQNSINNSCSESDFFSTTNSFCLMTDDSLSSANEGYSKSIGVKALKYEENWTKQFDSKFQFLGEYSKKNVSMTDAFSLESLYRARPSASQSQANSFVFTEFISGKNYASEKNLFELKSSECLNECSLLDSFVDSPISHQLPDLSFTQKPWSRIGFSSKSSDIKKVNSVLSTEETKNSMKKSECESITTLAKNCEPVMSLIELKRISNYSHSFSILYERLKEGGQDVSSDESSLLIQQGNKSRGGMPTRSRPSSKQIILGLWEQDQSLIKEFRPELAKGFPNLRMILLSDFIEDVKYLLTGINSSTFQYNLDTNCFTMNYGTCLEDVTPESLYHFSEEFIEAGNCYSKLSTYAVEIGKNNFDTCTTISQAFWKSIFDYLELHYAVVLEIPRTINLMSLKTCVREIHEMIATVAEICKVLKPDESLPEGGELLTYLINIAEKISKQNVRNLVFGILQNCCSVYYMCILQMWMFKGHLENQNNELFIDWKRQKMKLKSRNYYNSFYVTGEKAPVFLRGLEENIFNCGKSIHFLKLFNPEDKFIQILEKGDYPKMRPCLTVKELEKLDNDFKVYEARVIKTCGESASIKTLREEEKEKEKKYQDYVRECKKLQEKQREYLRQRTLENVKAEKDLKNKMLNEAWSLIEAEKERKRLEIEMEKKKFNEEMKAAAEIEGKINVQAKSTLRKYYDGLMDVVGKRISIAEIRKNSFLKMLESPSPITETATADSEFLDAINDNTTETVEQQIDDEGNLTGILDVNLNEKVDTEPKKTEKAMEYDENLNPSALPNEAVSLTEGGERNENPMNDTLSDCKKTDLYRSHSYRTLAAKEAAKNKCKVMKSEFGLDTRLQIEPETCSKKTENNMGTQLERNKRKVLESEYYVLRKDSHLEIKSVESMTDISKNQPVVPLRQVGASKKCSFAEKKTSNTEEEISFQGFELKRKFYCMNLEHATDEKVKETQKVESDSLTNIKSQKDVISEEIHGSSSGVEKEVSCVTIINEEYKNALSRDAKVFFHKLSQSDIFIKVESDDPITPCTDFIQVQRFLQKSALIPLRVQEKLANDALLSHLLKGESLLSHLKSLRSYFFLNDGEFGRSFTHNTFRSLAKCSEPKQFFERSNLSNIVNEALNYTIHNAEPNSQNLSFQINKMPLFLNHSFHDVLSPFELSYKVDWPLNIILTEKALSKYKIVFRFLLKLKRMNWTMNENFLFLNSYVKNKNFNSKALFRSPHYHKIQIYRHAISEIMITLDDYIFSNGIQFPWIYFLKDLETTENIDDLYQKHVKYIKDVLTRCFLSKNSEDLLECIHNLIEMALKFHYTTKSSIFEEGDGTYVHPKFEVVKTTFHEFCSILKTFLGILKEKVGTNAISRSHYVLIEKFDMKLS